MGNKHLSKIQLHIKEAESRERETHSSIEDGVEEELQMSLEGSLPETSGQVGQSVEESLQQREMLAVVVVAGHLCQGWQERGHQGEVE